MSIFVVWAYHFTSDLQPEIQQSLNLQFPEFPQHTSRGFQNITFIPSTLPTKTLTPTRTYTKSVIRYHNIFVMLWYIAGLTANTFW